MSNESGLWPTGVTILVLPDQVQEETESGIITATPAQLEREQLKQTDGVVIAIGPRAFHDEKDGRGDVVPRCKVGDRIVMTAYAGMVRKGFDGKFYRLINDLDVIGLITGEKTSE